MKRKKGSEDTEGSGVFIVIALHHATTYYKAIGASRRSLRQVLIN